MQQALSVGPTVIGAMQRNLRHHFRVPADFIAHICTARGDNIEASIENVSRAGIMISCDREILDILMPNEISFAPIQPQTIKVDFSLPLDSEGLVALSMDMIVVYTRRLSRDRFTVGLHVKNPTAQHEALLDNYVKENKLRA